jgi:hypothetical protein
MMPERRIIATRSEVRGSYRLTSAGRLKNPTASVFSQHTSENTTAFHYPFARRTPI